MTEPSTLSGPPEAAVAEDEPAESRPPRQRLELELGPLHPPLFGILYLELEIEGGRVAACRPDIGRLHRGVEKLCEEERYADALGHLDRLDSAAAVTTELAFARAVEELLGVEVPARARWARTLLAELQRLASHLLWLSAAATDLGAAPTLAPGIVAREAVLDLFEAYRGARVTVGAVCPGGLPADLPAEWADRCGAVLAELPARLDACAEVVSGRVFRERTAGVGVLSPEAALGFGVTGPMLRASGVDWDVRKVFPYEAYGEIDFEVPLGRNGDAFDRALVRVEEMREAVKIAGQCLKSLPEGPVRAELPEVPAVPRGGEAYASVEGPRGEIGFFLVAGGERPLRCRVRAPSFFNLQALPEMVLGCPLSELAVILASADVALGEVDR